MNLIYVGGISDIVRELDNPIKINPEIEIEDFNRILSDYIYRDNLSLIFITPLSYTKQNILLKFMEEFNGDIVIYMPEFRNTLLPTIVSRCVFNMDKNFKVKYDLMENIWRKEFGFQINSICYPMLLKYRKSKDVPRVKRAFMKSLIPFVYKSKKIIDIENLEGDEDVVQE